MHAYGTHIDEGPQRPQRRDLQVNQARLLLESRWCRLKWMEQLRDYYLAADETRYQEGKDGDRTLR
jgi:hypothetical protein